MRKNMGSSRKKTALDKEVADFIKNYPKGTHKKTTSSKKERLPVKLTRVPRRLYKK